MITQVVNRGEKWWFSTLSTKFSTILSLRFHILDTIRWKTAKSLYFFWKDGEYMFLGQFSHTVDAKGRTFVPAKYRDDLGET